MVIWFPVGSRVVSSSRLFVHNIHEELVRLGVKSKVYRGHQEIEELANVKLAIFQKWIDLKIIEKLKDHGVKIAIIPGEGLNELKRYQMGELSGDWEKAFDFCDFILTPYENIQKDFSKARLFYEAERKEDFVDIKKHGDTDKISLVWIGWPGTSSSIKVAEEGLRLFGNKYPTLLYMICGIDTTFVIPQVCPPIEIKIIPWGLNYPELLLAGDIGICPKPHHSLSSANVAKTMMWAGLPVVASPIDTYQNLAEECQRKKGFSPIKFANNSEEWFKQLSNLTNANVRTKIGQKVREVVEKEYSVKKEAKKIIQIIKECTDG